MSSRTQKPITTHAFGSPVEALHHLARELCGLIRMKAFQRSAAILGLPAGETLDELYAETLRRSGVKGKGGLDYGKVHVFCLGEIPGAAPSMRERLWKAFGEPAGIPTAQFHGVDELPGAGKLGVAVVRLGASGHLEFNDPGATEEPCTRTVAPDAAGRAALARDLPDLAEPPAEIVTIGLASLTAAERVRILALGVDASTPPAVLRGHKDCQILTA